MRKTTLLLGLAFAVTTLSGCDDDVTKVCKKMAEIAGNEKDLPEEAKKEMADIEKCKKEAGEEQKKDPEQFKKMSDCVMGVSDMGGVMKCAMEAEGAGDDDKKEEEKK
ncbi:MAG: hypothetical protein KUG77_30060 [Nannocystaceae bacterium]|nr:hypothetical protein [Nannocystaceae bacterium]